MKLANFSVNRPVTVVMVVLAILIIGAVSLGDLNLDLFPEINLPVAAVITSYGGSAPQEVENMVTRPLENTLGTVSNVSSISSTSSTGSSTIIIQFEFGTDMEFAALEVRENIDLVKGFLPDDAGEPMVFKMDPNMMPILQLGIGGDIPSQELMYIAENNIKPRLERIEGVASVDITGGMTREIQVTVEPEKLQAHGLALNQVIQAIQSQNMNLSAGKITEGAQDLMVRVTGEFKNTAQIAATPITTPGGNLIQLADVAQVEDAFREVTSYSRVNGLPSIGLAIQKQANANTVQVVREVRAALEDIRQQLPGGLEIATTLDQAELIEQSIQNVVRNLIIGGALAVFVLFIFLRNIRSTLVIGLAMPIAVISTFILIYFGGLTLNMMTLGGLALGIGMMVDSAIVVVENIFRHREEGYDSIEGARLGANEVSSAITAATFTTVGVFFPIVFVQGIASELFTELALTVSFALIASLVVALTLIPMLSSRLLKVNGTNGNERSKGTIRRLVKVTGEWFKVLERSYGKTLRWCLGHRKSTVGLVLALLIGSLALIPFIGAEFIPGMDEGTISVRVNLPDGAKLDETDQVVRQVELAFESFAQEIESISASVGGSGGFGGSANPGRGAVNVLLVPQAQRTHSTNEIAETVRQELVNIAGAEIRVRSGEGMGGMGMSGAPIEISVQGDDLDQLQHLAEEITALVEQVPGTKDVTNSFEQGQQEIRLAVDINKAARYGLNVAQIASAARTGIEGQVATRYRTGSEEIDVRVRLAEGARSNLAAVENIMIASAAGQVPLGEVVEVHYAQGMSSIVRQDQVRVVSITASLDNRDLASVMTDVEKTVNENLVLVPGYTVKYGGEATEMVEAFGDLAMALLLAILLVYMIMASQFESLLHPFIIMFTMPVTVIGVILALVITGQTFSVVTFIGIIMLAGIVVNNAIVLVDYINVLRRRGMAKEEAILLAGPTRLRPILMTALTTILAMIPLALGIGEGAEMQAPMAIAVIGGLTTSTFLTLLFIPVMYSLLDDFSDFITGRKKNLDPKTKLETTLKA